MKEVKITMDDKGQMTVQSNLPPVFMLGMLEWAKAMIVKDMGAPVHKMQDNGVSDAEVVSEHAMVNDEPPVIKLEPEPSVSNTPKE